MDKLAQGVSIEATFGSPFKKLTDVGTLISLGLRIAFVLAGLFILFAFVYAGFQMVAEAGNSDQQAAAKAKQAATSAVIGFVVVFTAYWIVRIIEIVIGTSFITGGAL